MKHILFCGNVTKMGGLFVAWTCCLIRDRVFVVSGWNPQNIMCGHFKEVERLFCDQFEAGEQSIRR